MGAWNGLEHQVDRRQAPRYRAGAQVEAPVDGEPSIALRQHEGLDANLFALQPRPFIGSCPGRRRLAIVDLNLGRLAMRKSSPTAEPTEGLQFSWALA